MKTNLKWTLAAVVAVAAIGALAQGAGMGAGRGRGAAGARLYDSSTETTLKGQVAAVEMTGPMALGVHIQLTTADGTTAVHLGPLWFLQGEKMTVAVGDALEVTGSRITFEGKPAVIAREIHKGSQTLVLRDAQGFPVWAGRGRRP